jgi:hypothetical protein
MAIEQIPQQSAYAARGAVEEFRNKVSQVSGNRRYWARSLALGSLITGVVLLARGQRKAGVAVTIAGAAAALLEDPQDATELWNSIPRYLESGRRVISRFESFIEELSAQSSHIRSFLENARK